jgi:DNA polymerase-4
MEARQKSGSNLLIVPPDYEVYGRASDALMDLMGNYSPIIEKFSIDEAFLNYTGMQKLFGDPVERAHKIKDEIHEKLGFTVNVGVSTNKLLAKMASEFQKPDRVHTLWPDEIKTKMWPLPIEELYMVGRRTSLKLRHKGIDTIGDFAELEPGLIKSWLNSPGVTLWQFANGIYQEEDKGGAAFFQGMMTQSPKHEVKGIGNSGTISFDITKLEVAHQALLSLSETVGYRLRKGGYRSYVMHVGFTTPEFERFGKQMKFGLPTNNTNEIYMRACKVFDSFWNGQKIRQIGIRTSDLTQSQDLQADFFTPIETLIKNQNLDKVIDQIRHRYGNTAILRGHLIKAPMDPMIGGTFGLASHRPEDGLPV